MALSAKERKRRQMERQREQLEEMSDSTYPFLRKPFYKYLEEEPEWTNVDMCFDLLGINAPMIEDDRGPKDFASPGVFDEDTLEEQFGRYPGSIGRAEMMIGILLDAVANMAFVVNTYKKEELRRRLAEIEEGEFADPASRKQALDDAVRIRKMLEVLEKQTRRTLHQWEVKGI